MADLTTADVTVLKKWAVGDNTGKLVAKTVVALIESGTAGGTTNKIVPAAFGMRRFLESSAIAVGNNVRPTAVIADGSAIHVTSLSTNATQQTPADINFGSTAGRITVTGDPL